MTSLQTVKPFFFRYTWQFRELYTDKTSSLSCIAFSTEEARMELLSTLKQIESLAHEKKTIEDKINKLYMIRRTQSYDESAFTMNQIFELMRTLQQKFPPMNDYAGGHGIRANDYNCDIKVIYYRENTSEEVTTTLGTYISTIEPVIESARFVTLT